MLKNKRTVLIILCFMCVAAVMVAAFAWGGSDEEVTEFLYPFPEDQYQDQGLSAIGDIWSHRLAIEPFNLVATALFVLAILHTMSVSFFQKLAAHFEGRYHLLLQQDKRPRGSKSLLAGFMHLLGEVEVVFGIWALILAIAISAHFSWETFTHYIDSIQFTEPLFIIVIMSIASSRPILQFFELILWRITRQLGGSLIAWWLVILTLAPLLGSLITEPAAMTVAAFLLADKFYSLNPSRNFKYATLALLFVNISIGGVLTNFAAPPILMVAGPWGWDSLYMFMHFGWKSMLAIVLSNGVYYMFFKRELNSMLAAFERNRYKHYVQHRFISKHELEKIFEDLERIVDKNVAYTKELDAFSNILKENIKALAHERLSSEDQHRYDIDAAIDERFEDIKNEEFSRTIPGLMSLATQPDLSDEHWNSHDARVPIWIMCVHLLLLLWTVLNGHEPVVFMAGFLTYLAFHEITSFYQNKLDLKPALFVAFFIAGIMIHGNLQSWWISPLLANLPENGLNLTAIFLTSFNDNAAITYLSTLVPNFPENLKYAIVTGAITGGGLTLIANAPNPVGQSILKQYFSPGISSGLLLRYAILPTIITALVFGLLNF